MAKSSKVERIFVCKTCGGVLENREHGVGPFKKIEKFCDNCAKESKKGGWKSDVECQQVYRFTCPCCNERTRVTDIKAQDLRCPLCKRPLRFDLDEVFATSTAVSEVKSDDIKGDVNNPWIVVTHPAQTFNKNTRVTPRIGCKAFFVAGTEKHLLAEMANPFTTEEDVDGRIVFVLSSIPNRFALGTSTPPTVYSQSEHLQATVKLSAYATVKIVNEEAFLEWDLYQDARLKDVVDGHDGIPALKDILFNTFNDDSCLSGALQSVVSEGRATLQTLELNRKLVLDRIRENMNARLANIGLAIDTCEWNSFNVEVGQLRDSLLTRVGRSVNWETSPIRVHEASDPNLYANLTLGGTGTINLVSRDKLLSFPEGQRWNNPSYADEEEAARTIGSELGRQLNAVFQQLLQNMINDTKAPIHSLSQYLAYMQNHAMRYLNETATYLTARGLAVEGLTVEVRRSDMSPALAARANVNQTISVKTIEQEMKRFNDKLTIENAGDDSSVRIRLEQIQGNETQQMYGIHRGMKDTGTQEAMDEMRRQMEVERLQHEQELERLKMKTDYQMTSNQMGYSVETQVRDMQNSMADQAVERRHERELQDLDHAYAAWQKKRRMEIEQVRSAMDEQDARQQHAINAQHRQNQAGRDERVADEQLRSTLHQIVRGIEESNLDWKKKLEAYAHLQAMTEANDQMDLAERKAKSEISLFTISEEAKLHISRETAEQLEQRARYAEERQERIRKADFAREMERQRVETAHEIQLLQFEMDRKRQEQEWEFKQFELEYQIARLQTQLSHDETMDEHNVTREKYRTDAQTAQTQFTHNYDQLKQQSEAVQAAQQAQIQQMQEGDTFLQALVMQSEQKRQELEVKHQKELTDMMSGNAERIERLYESVLNLEKQRDEMHTRKEWAYNEGRAMVDVANATGGDTAKIDQMFEYIKRLEGEMQKLRQSIRAKTNTNTGNAGSNQEPVTGTNSNSPERRCPNCNTVLEKYMNYCPKCGKYV